jgi:H+/Cl- antiporter ClcA
MAEKEMMKTMKIKTHNTRIGLKHTLSVLVFIFGLIIGCYVGAYALFANTILKFIFSCNDNTLNILFVIFSLVKIFLAPIIGGFIILLSYNIAEQIGK